MSVTGLLFAAGFAVGCFLAFARHPVYGLITYVAVYYLHPPSRWWGEALPDLRWSLLAACVTLVSLWAGKSRVTPASIGKEKFWIGLVIFILWLTFQSLWAMDMPMHLELLTVFTKYALLVVLIYKCVDSTRHLKLFLWAHVLGCTYLGWVVFTTYIGGRFEGFGGPDINEANSGALQVVTGIVTAGALFLAGRFKERLVLAGCMPLIVNALVSTMSRSGFLAIGVSGAIYNYLVAVKFRTVVRVMTILAVVLFLVLANPVYWARIASIKYAGEEVEGVDTGAGRLVLIQAQMKMFAAHPWGCGHRCTAVLSRRYLEDKDLTGVGADRARSSHNTIMSLLVEQGLPGVFLYGAMISWIFRSARKLKQRFRDSGSFLAEVYPAVAASLGAICLGDLFVDYLKAEVRIWFIAILMVLVRLSTADQAKSKGSGSASNGAPPTGNAPRCVG